MNRRFIGVFVFALVVASVTSFVVYRLILAHVQTPSSAPRAILASNTLLVAAHDLQVGALIKDSDIVERPWAGTIPKEAQRIRQDLVGRGVISSVYEDEPFLDQRLAPKGSGAGLAATIPVGKRAVALRVNDVIGLAGFVLPGMRVDVLAAGDIPGDDAAAGKRCRTILQNIEVLSAGQHIEKSPEGKPESAEVVNLLVSPDQAEILNLASGETKVQLVLRNPLDTKEETTHGTSLAGLFGEKVASRQLLAKAAPLPAAPLAAAPPPPTVEVFSGSKKADQVIALPSGGGR